MELTPYLVQRAEFTKDVRNKFQADSSKHGIDGILNLSYMGSAEFEYGALPDSLKRIRQNKNEYHYSYVKMNGRSLVVFYKKDISSVELSKYFNGLSDGSFRLKEYSGFNTYINDLSLGGTTLKNKTDFWWDIKNDMMFWKKNEEFTKDFKSRIIK